MSKWFALSEVGKEVNETMDGQCSSHLAAMVVHIILAEVDIEVTECNGLATGEPSDRFCKMGETAKCVRWQTDSTPTSGVLWVSETNAQLSALGPRHLWDSAPQFSLVSLQVRAVPPWFT